MGYERVIKRWMDAPANLRINWYQSAPAVTPCLGHAHHVLRMLIKVPIEAGIFDRTLIARLSRCFLQPGTNQLITDIAVSCELGSLWSTVTYLQTPALLAGMVLRTMFNPNMMVSANLRTEQIRIHQSMDTTPVVNIANVDPFANHPLVLNDQTSVPGMEFTCVTADFTGRFPVTNYLRVQFTRNTAVMKRYINTLAETTNGPPTIAIWDTDIWMPNLQEAAGFI